MEDTANQSSSSEKLTGKGLMAFLIPSLIGIFLFMTPITKEDEITIPVAMLAGWVGSLFGSSLPYIMTVIMGLTVIGTLLAKTVKPHFIMGSHFFRNLFNVNALWTAVRIIGLTFAIMTLFKIGPEMVWSDVTGTLLLMDLIPILFSVFLFAGLFLPLLMNFGLLELFGALLTKAMRPIFTLPGRSSIDCLASWMGDGTIGVLLTNKQYEEGYYSRREAAVIGTTFSVVSITFSIVVIDYMNLAHMFPQYYLTIAAAGFVAAVIMPRIPPLSRKDNGYEEKSGKKIEEEIPAGHSAWKWGLLQAVHVAKDNMQVKKHIKGGVQNVLDMWMGVIPVVMALGTIAVIIAEYTPLFHYLGMPFIPFLNVMGVPEASAAAETVLVGFADMFLPAVIGSGIESDFTRFIIASLSVTQLIYMSEVGGLLLGSKLPVTFTDLIVIFLERTIITLPIIVLMAHLFF